MTRVGSVALLCCSILALVALITASKHSGQQYATVKRVLREPSIANPLFNARTATESSFVNPPHRSLANPPNDGRYKTKSFPVSGSDDSECNVKKCSAWDWNNHTHVTSGPSDSPYAEQAPSDIPPFVKNMSYIPDFICYDGNIFRWTAATASAFDDPVPSGYVVTKVRKCTYSPSQLLLCSVD